MAARFDADGDTWEVGYELHDGRPDLDAVVFHCITNSQRPYRVIPLPPDARGGHEAGEAPSTQRLQQLFGRSQVMDFVRDAEADPHNPGMRTAP